MTLKVNQQIRKSQKKLDELFITYNETYPNRFSYSSTSEHVTDKENGEFWMDSSIDSRRLIANRVIIDAWCALMRCEEEKELLERDVMFLEKHTLSDINALNDVRTYSFETTVDEVRVYEYLIRKRIAVLKCQMSKVSQFTETFDNELDVD